MRIYLQKTQNIIKNEVLDNLNHVPASNKLICGGRLWDVPDYNIYIKLLAVSEYDACFYIFGFRANHFTILVNHLRHFTGLIMVNKYLKQNGFILNSTGGEIKGSKEIFLEQSSTFDDKIEVDFKDSKLLIPSCYYEFAIRHVMPYRKLYTGFNTKSANKVFESTNVNQDS